jgi:hypothetical protein
MCVRDAWSQDVVLKAMCDHIAWQHRQGIHLDFILATGDLAFSGQVKEYQLVETFFDALCMSSGVPKDRIFCIPGNHDIDRERQKFCFLGAREFLQNQNRVDALLSPERDLETLLERQENYRQFQDSYFIGQDRTELPGRLGYVSRLTIDHVRLAIIGFDSAWFAEGGAADHGKLLIGERQAINAITLAQGSDNPTHVIVGMAHHPFHLLKEFDRQPTQYRIERACHFFHCGHLHEPETRIAGSAKTGCLTFSAGAAYDTRQSNNTYSIVTLDLVLNCTEKWSTICTEIYTTRTAVSMYQQTNHS